MSLTYFALILKAEVFEEGIDLNSITFERRGIGQRDVLYQIYDRRSKIGNVVPYKLVQGLKNFKGEEVLLTAVVHKDDKYLMFTDVDVTYFIGITEALPDNMEDSTSAETA
jgi:hypothetical protein